MYCHGVEIFIMRPYTHSHTLTHTHTHTHTHLHIHTIVSSCMLKREKNYDKEPGFFPIYVDFRPYSGTFPAFLFSQIFSFLTCTSVFFFPEHFEWLTSTVPQFVEKILQFFLKNRHRKVYFPTLSSLPSQPHASQSNLKGVDDF